MDAVRKKAMMDQNIATMSDVFPTMWAGMFRKLLTEGFTREEALDLVKTYIRTLK